MTEDWGQEFWWLIGLEERGVRTGIVGLTAGTIEWSGCEEGKEVSIGCDSGLMASVSTAFED